MRTFTRAERLRSVPIFALRTGPMLARLRWPQERLRAWQLRRLRALLDHAYTHSPFYRERLGGVGFRPGELRRLEELQALPLTSKEDLREALAQGILTTAPPGPQDFLSQSSGSTGHALTVRFGLAEMREYAMATYRCYAMLMPYGPWHRMVYVYTAPFPVKSFFGLYAMTFVPTLAPISELLDTIRRVRPQILVCYPSQLRELLGSLSTAQARALGLRVVSCNSEQSVPAEREAWSQQLGAPVYDEYSSEEMGRIASHCQHSRYHVFDDLNVIELLDDQGRPAPAGELVGTNLVNRTMPFIRYRQGDRASWGPETCPCGATTRSLAHVEGRQNDSFLLPSGRRLASGYLLDATYALLLEWPGAVAAFQLVQSSRTEALFRFVPGPAYAEDLRLALAQRLAGLLGPELRLSLEPVTALQRTASGKCNPICSLVPRDT